MTKVLPGLDFLIQGQNPLSARLQTQKLGLLTNQIGLTQDDRPALEALRAAEFNILALFTPEHGIAGDLEGAIDNSQLPDGTPIYSLYGQIQRPTPEMLAELDVVVCDLQDVGARFYTNATTIYEIMEGCASLGKRVVILDRPNPLGGHNIEGPFIDPSLMSFIGAAPLPVTHGMTLGELALFYRNWKKLDVEVEIVPAQGWNRAMKWPECDLKWRRPSPNLPDFASAAWYPGLALLEFCRVSVGRGTHAPFQILGSPDFHVEEFLRAFVSSEDINTRPIEFTPTHATFAGEKCVGVEFDCVHLPQRPVEFGLRVMHAFRASHPDFPHDNWNRAGKLIGSQATLDALWNGDFHSALEKADADAAQFREERAPFLIY